LTWPVTKTLGVAYDISGKQPPLEQRVERLERRLRAQGSEMSQAIEELRSDMRKETYSKIQAAMAEAEERENRLRAFISETYGLGLLRRKVGVGLFVAGLALSAAGNLVAT
jgi:hypothetical protein